MTLISRGWIVMALVLAALVPAAGATAESPDRIVSQGVAAIRQTADGALSAVQAAVRESTAALVRADHNGATNRELTVAANRAKASIRQIGERALTAVSEQAARSQRALNDAGGTERQAAAIRTAAANASNAIRAAVARGQNSIQQLLDRLLG